MKPARIPWPLLAPIVLALACSKDPKLLAEVAGREVTQEEADAFLAFKRVPSGDARAEKLFDDYLSREALAEAIKEMNALDEQRIKVELGEFEKEMLISRYFEKFLDDKVTDEAVKSYYESHAKDYEERRVHAAHILIRIHAKMTEAEREAKLTTIRDIHAKLAAGADFADLAKTHSEDRVSGTKGGDLDWVKEGIGHPKLSEVLFTLEPGMLSDVFETSFGFHVAKVLEPPQVIRKPLTGVAGDIRYRLRAEAKDAELTRLRGLVEIERKAPLQKTASPTTQRSLPQVAEPPTPQALVPQAPSETAATTLRPQPAPEPSAATAPSPAH